MSKSLHWSRPLSPFVGRARALATLEVLLARVRGGEGHAVGIVGEPGIGKSRLLYEFHCRQADMSLTYMASECLSYGINSPYLPVVHFLRQMCAITEADIPETIASKVSECLDKAQMPHDTWAPPLLYLLGEATSPTALSALSPQALKGRIFSALLQLCVNSSQQRPLVLEIENVHWIDATTEEWLSALVERLAGHPILLLLTFRPEYRPAWWDASHVTELSLACLSPEQSRQVLRAVPEGAQFDEPLTREILAKANGNPFFLEELRRAVLEHPSDRMPTIPDTVQAVLAARMDRLPASEKHLLQVASVIGKEVPLQLLEGVVALPTPVLQQGLEHLQTAGFLYEMRLIPYPVYTFKHTLTQDVAYQSLLAGARQPYHDRIAQLLLERFPGTVASQPERVAHHYTEAGHFEEALPYWQRAGEQAVARSANLEAMSHFTRGLEVLQRLPVTTERNRHELRLQLALSAPLFMKKGVAAAGYSAQRVLELCQELEDSMQYFPQLAVLWRFLFNAGQIQKAQEVGQQCFTLAHQAQDPVLLLEAHAMLGSIFFVLGELSTARSHFQQSAHLYDAQHTQARVVHWVVDPGIIGFCRGAWTLWLLGYADQALATINQALTLARTTAHAFSLVFTRFYVGIIHQCRREIGALHEDAEAVMETAREHEFAYYESGALFLQGLALADQGAPEVGLRKLCEALAVWKVQGMFGLSAMYVTLAGVYRTCGQIEAGLHVLDDALRIVHTYEERYYEAEIYRLRGELLLHPSVLDATQAEACFQRACAIAARQHAKAWELRAVMSLSRLWQQQGKPLAACQKLEPLYGWFTEGFTTPDLQEARQLLDILT